MTFGIGIISYCGWLRVDKLLESLKDNDVKVPITVFEDLSPYPEVTQKYKKVCDKHGVPLSTAEKWGCGQGNAHRAMVEMNYDVVFLLADDSLATPHAIDNMVYFWENNPGIKLGGVLFPVWQVDSASAITGGTDSILRLGLIRNREEIYALDLNDVPFNLNWDKPKVIHCFHCSGFALNRKLYFDLGGFSQSHWANDEDIAWKIWLKSDYICAVIPGNPLIHLGAMSQCSKEYQSLIPIDQRAEIPKDWGMTFDELMVLHHKVMAEKGPGYNEILKRAKTYQTK